MQYKTKIISLILTAMMIVSVFGNAKILSADTTIENETEETEITEEVKKEIGDAEDSIEDIEDKIGVQEQQRKDLEEKKKEYLKVIRTEQSKQDSLESQIAILEAKEGKLEIDIQQTQSQVDDSALEIQKTILKIEDAERKIIGQKEILSGLLRTIYKNDQESDLEIFLKNDTLSEFLDQVKYIEKTHIQTDKTLTKVKDAKEELGSWKVKQEKEKGKLKELKIQQTAEKEVLENEKIAKETLLAQTKNQEAKFQGLLARVYQQKKIILGDIEQLRREKEKELARLQALQAKPVTGLALESWYYSQTDSRWGNINIGFSKSLMKNYGCAVSCVAMIFKHYGININPGQLARQPIFYYDLIVWPKQWRFLDLALNTFHNGVDWKRIDKEIESGHPVIVFVNANQKNGGHYVVIHHKKKGK